MLKIMGYLLVTAIYGGGAVCVYASASQDSAGIMHKICVAYMIILFLTTGICGAINNIAYKFGDLGESGPYKDAICFIIMGLLMTPFLTVFAYFVVFTLTSPDAPDSQVTFRDVLSLSLCYGYIASMWISSLIALSNFGASNSSTTDETFIDQTPLGEIMDFFSHDL